MAPRLERFVSPGKGNGLRATAGVRRGELLFSAEPLASCVSNRVRGDVCHRCFTRRETLLRCSQCKTARYCNITCQKQAWSVHKRECKCLRGLLPRVPTDSVRLAARLIFALFSPSKGSSKELYTLEEHESHLTSMSEQKKQGLSQLASMLELYLRQEAPDLAQEMTSSLPPSCREPLSLIAKLTISYIETLSLTEDRQRQLEEQYHFTCHCQRCDSQDKDGLMLSGEEATWRLLKEALPRLEEQKAESLHGVQLMRVGKLQHYLEHIADALDTFKQAFQIIKLTHGDDHPLTADLLMKMEECRSELDQKSSSSH
ncbi:hypothetical protein F2P81_004683 [Scophthalmus maximus]|uniref:[histone H3]-lysine(4) N-trimethyltransferase n=1 Tax=Scophthalmus maximus TaxID=52904 RepID=A0A6A4T6Z8_SCOMX|nr:hypothetical protein F2P81_004683 [Scophthalmus maximus]